MPTIIDPADFALAMGVADLADSVSRWHRRFCRVYAPVIKADAGTLATALAACQTSREMGGDAIAGLRRQIVSPGQPPADYRAQHAEGIAEPEGRGARRRPRVIMPPILALCARNTITGEQAWAGTLWHEDFVIGVVGADSIHTPAPDRPIVQARREGPTDRQIDAATAWRLARDWIEPPDLALMVDIVCHETPLRALTGAHARKVAALRRGLDALADHYRVEPRSLR